MHDFDVERDERLKADRQFQIGGEVFEYKPAVAPEALVRWADMNESTPEKEAIEIIDATVLAFLTPNQDEKWRQVRDVNAGNPLTANDIIGVIRWLVEEQAGRPTTPSSGSTNGSGATTGTSSTDTSDSPVEAVSAATT